VLLSFFLSFNIDLLDYVRVVMLVTSVMHVTRSCNVLYKRIMVVAINRLASI
jgi:hypothetical protein